MIEIASTNPILIDFLAKYPEPMRKICAEAAMIYGVQTIKNKFPYGLTVNQLISVSGFTDYEDSYARLTSSCNISIANNRSVEATRLLSESIAKLDEKTERYREVSQGKKKPFKKSLTRIGSEKAFAFSHKIKEPVTCPYETAQNFFYKPKPDLYKEKEEFQRENAVMKIADDFLKNGYATYLRTQAEFDTKPVKGFQLAANKRK